jgi:MscS family membrane protein
MLTKTNYTALALTSLVLFVAAPPAAFAQAGLPGRMTAPAQAQQAPAPAPPPPEEVAPDSPLASMREFFDAANEGRWSDASRYLVIPAGQQARRDELTRHLKSILDIRRPIDLETLSGESAGRLDDRLPGSLEQVGTIGTHGQAQPVRLIKSSDAQGAFWAFSATTVSHVDDWYAALPDRWLRDAVAGTPFRFLLRTGPFDILWWQWLALPVLALLSWGAGLILRAIVRPVVRRITARTSNTWDDKLVESLGPPLTLAFTVVLFAIGCGVIQIAPAAFGVVGTMARPVMAFAVFWGLWRVDRVLVAWAMTRPWAVNSASARSLLSIGANIVNGVIVAIGIVSMVAALGYPVSTVLAGLGIGGLALAFGAQKTVENAFGSVALAVDQPIRIGDFVKVEDFVGTVENIGLRSTRIRTLDRTVVSIPNGKLSDQRLESFEARDRMRLATTVSLTYSTTRAQMETVLKGLEAALRAHPRIWPDAVIVKFKEFAASSMDIEIMAWFQVPTWGDFQRCREDVLLEFMGVVENAGASFAFPTRTVHMVGK